MKSLIALFTSIGLLVGFIGGVIFWSSAAESATFTVEKYTNSSEHYISMEGRVVEGDLERLREAYLDHRIKRDSVLILDSPGGELRAMLGVVKFVKEKGLATRVGSNTECYSACALIWLAGEKRHLHGNWRLGFHVGSYTSESLQGIFEDGGLEEVQKRVQLSYSIDLDYIIDNMELRKPYEFVYNLSKFGYTRSTFYEPTEKEIVELIGETIITE